MNTTDLTGPDLSAAVAVEVMRFRQVTDSELWWRCDDTNELRVYGPKSDWCPHCDIRQARTVITEIQRRGLMLFLEMRFLDLHREGGRKGSWSEYLLTCPPADICRAALAVVRETKGDGT